MAGSGGPKRDARKVLAQLVASCPRALTTPQLVERSGFTAAVVRRHLHELGSEGHIGMLSGKPQRWYWIGAAAEWAAVA